MQEHHEETSIHNNTSTEEDWRGELLRNTSTTTQQDQGHQDQPGSVNVQYNWSIMYADVKQLDYTAHSYTVHMNNIQRLELRTDNLRNRSNP